MNSPFKCAIVSNRINKIANAQIDAKIRQCQNDVGITWLCWHFVTFGIDCERKTEIFTNLE